MNQPSAANWSGIVTQCQCSHCGEMYASNYIHTCDNPKRDAQGQDALAAPVSYRIPR